MSNTRQPAVTNHPLTPARIVGGLLLMVIVPSEVLALAAAVQQATSDRGIPPEFILLGLAFSPLLGLVMGFPWLVGAVVLWFILERTGQARAQPAAVSGLLIGGSASFFPSFYSLDPWLLDLAVRAAVGCLTGLAVWWAAHFKLPPPR